MSKINWIHLSDWHQKDEEFDRRTVRNALVKDIEKRKDFVDARLETIDFIIFSGDLTFSGTTGQYRTAVDFFLQPILKAADVSSDRLFIVPGNHDLNRNNLKYLSKDLRNRPSKREEVNDYLDDDIFLEQLLIPFKGFTNEIGKFAETGRFEYAGFHNVEKDNTNISIFGLNSALFCAREKDANNEYRDRGNLVIGELQFVDCIDSESKALKEISADTVIRIGVVHHPLDQLDTDLDNDVIKRIEEHCDFFLSGHTHRFDTRQITGINTQIRTISAGASYDRRKESNSDYNMSYNFVHLDSDTNQGTIFYRRWDDPEWGAYLIDNRMKEGKVDFKIREDDEEPPEEPGTTTVGGGDEAGVEVKLPGVNVEKYRTWLQQETEWLDFRPFFPGSSIGLAVSLKNLYFDIKIEHSGIQEIVEANPRILLEGKPGSGKSTILQYLALVYSQNKNILPLWFKASNLLSFISQKRLSTQTQQLSRILIQFWCEHHEVAKELFSEDWLVEQMRQGKVLFLMDGLDELFEHSSPILRNIIDDVVKQYDKSRWVITCLSNGSTPPQHFKKFRIDPFSDEEIGSYSDSLTEVLMDNKEKFRKVPPNEEAFKHDVIQMIFDHPDSIDFFRSPLTLTVAICLYWSRDNESRLEMEAHIYEYALKLLFDRRIRETSLFPLKNDTSKIRKCLQLLALDVYADKANPERYFGGPSECLAKIAGIFGGNREKAQELIEWEEAISGLTKRNKAGSIRYQNKALLLYFAACELAERFKNDEQQSKEALEKHFARENENWQKIISFIPIIISQKKWGDRLIKSFIAYLLASRENDSLAECVRVIGGLKNILFYIWNFGINPDEIPGFQGVKKIAMGLFDEGKEDISPKERYNAAIAIGFAGDPRFEDLSSNWVFIPGGQARIGATKAEDDYAKSNENPAHRVYTAAFEIGKYPVTVEEYLRFMEDGGYTNKNLWDDDGLKWLQSSKADKPRYWQELQQFQPNCPVVYVCYHEANAYCKWLSSRNDKYLYRLPTEAQWEYVARRGEEKYEPYVYPGITPRSLAIQINWDNIERAHIRNVCPVGMYPLDATKDNVRDMNGNISEWTATPETEYLKEALQADKQLPGKSNCQMVRGGSFRSYARDCRTARRTLQFKQVDNYDLGFRVVRMPKALAMKGVFPANDYTVSLGHIFYKYFDQITDSKNIPERLKHFTWFDYENISLYKDNLYPDYNKEERKQFKRRPVVLGDYDEWEKKLAYNLRYQDSQIKVAVERKIGRNVELTTRETDIEQILEIIAYTMNSDGIEHEKLWMDMTDGDLDGLVLQVLSAYDKELTERLVTTGIKTNKIALAGLLSVAWKTIPIIDFVGYQVFAGTMWWAKCDEHNAVPARTLLKIDDIESFEQVIKNGEKQLIILFDDNGELVWDLAFILLLLNGYSRLQITAVVNKNAIYNNACMATVKALIDDEESPLHELDTFLRQKRFVLFEESCYRTSIDPKYCSKELLALLAGADLAFIKGSTGFETMQNLPVDTYYAFVSWGEDSRQYTNVEELKGIFVRVPKGRAGYEYPGTTLKELYKAKQLSYFKLTKQSFEKLRDEHIPKNVLEGLKLLENKEIISKEKFLGAIEKEIGKEQTVKYKELVLKHVSSY